MKIGELVRCPRCNSENPPEYRFCGMCGTPLDKPVEPPVRNVDPVAGSERPRRPEPPSQPSASQSLSGPSFLGLSGPARGSEDVTYLFEEEQPRRTYWRFIVLLLVLGVLGGLGYLQYHSGKSWTPPWANQKPTTPEQASQQPPPAPQPNTPATAPAGTSPANAQPAAQNQTGNPAQPKETDIAPGTTPPGSQAQPANNNQPNQPAPESTPANSETAKKPAEPAPTDNTAGTKDNAATAKDNATVAKKEAAPEDQPDTADHTAVTKPKPARVKPAPVPATNPDDALVTNAEKYLYGRGVPQNCDRALVSLKSAADRQNSRAQSLLGTMYGTGHCVPRDLPNAYRWFALASRQQSDNMYIQRNLEMIWREMTPQERQLAMQSNR